jgi:hypothetical protein
LHIPFAPAFLIEISAAATSPPLPRSLLSSLLRVRARGSTGIRARPLHCFPSLAGFLACAPQRQENPAASPFRFLTPDRAGQDRSIGDASSLLQLQLKNQAPPSQPPSRRRRSRFFFSVLEPFLVLLRRLRMGGEDQDHIFFLRFYEGAVFIWWAWMLIQTKKTSDGRDCPWPVVASRMEEPQPSDQTLTHRII